MTNQTYLTKRGKSNLEMELVELKGPRRRDLARRLKSAIEMGDLSENADYKAAKEDQGFLEGRILELESILKNAIVLDDSDIKSDEISIGHKITVREGKETPETIELVGAKEADPRSGKISYESPLGSALLGRKKGDTVSVLTPGGVLEFTIIEIE